MAVLKLRITGMHCANCKAKVERALKGVSGTYGVLVDERSGDAEVDFDGKASAEKFVEAVRSVGYTAEIAA